MTAQWQAIIANGPGSASQEFVWLAAPMANRPVPSAASASSPSAIRAWYPATWRSTRRLAASWKPAAWRNRNWRNCHRLRRTDWRQKRQWTPRPPWATHRCWRGTRTLLLRQLRRRSHLHPRPGIWPGRDIALIPGREPDAAACPGPRLESGDARPLRHRGERRRNHGGGTGGGGAARFKSVEDALSRFDGNELASYNAQRALVFTTCCSTPRVPAATPSRGRSHEGPRPHTRAGRGGRRRMRTAMPRTASRRPI